MERDSSHAASSPDTPGTERPKSEHPPMGSASAQAGSLPLPAEDSRNAEDSTTVRILPPAHEVVTPRWGAVLDEPSQQLAFTLKGRAEPVIVSCTHELIIGRSSRAGAPPDFDLGQFSALAHGVSRHHAKIWYDADLLKLVDLGSTNGTFLNGLRLPARQPRILRDGDEVTFGRLSVRIHVI